MLVAKYRVGESVYYWVSGKITKVTITSCIIDDEIDYTAMEQGKEKGSTFCEEQLFPTALDAAKEYKIYLLNRISDFDKCKEELVADLTKLQKEHGC